MSSQAKTRNDLTWDDDVGMWRGDIALKEDVHVIRWSVRQLAKDALEGILDRMPVERVLTNVRRGQEKEGDLRGNFWMTLEDGKVTDRNNGFFTTFHLLLLKHEFADQLTEKARRDIDHMLSEAEHWFAYKVLPINERKLRYPNAFLGDAVCLWLVRELNGTIDSEFRKTFQEILTYYRKHNWGWGEHLSDGYSKWCIRECAALLMWGRHLDKTTRALAEELAAYLMAIDAQFAGGPRVPTLRCYDMDTSPRTPDSHPERYRQYRELMQSKTSEGTASPLDVVAGQHGVFSDLVPAEPNNPARTIPCYGESRAESWVTPRWRYGTMTNYPLFEDTNVASGWGLHWQSMPVAFWHCAGDWGYLQWVTEENGVRHALPGFTKKHTQRNNLCRLSDTDETATCGLTRGARVDDALVVYRELPGIAEAWPWAADRFRLVYPTADARTDEVDSWHRLILDYGEEVLTVACRPLQDGTECLLDTNAAPEVTGEDLERRKAHELHFTAHHELASQHVEVLRFLWFMRMADTDSQPPHVKQVNGDITVELAKGDTMRFAGGKR